MQDQTETDKWYVDANLMSSVRKRKDETSSMNKEESSVKIEEDFMKEGSDSNTWLQYGI